MAEATGAKFLGANAARKDEAEDQQGEREESDSGVEGGAVYLDYAVDGMDARIKGVRGLDGGDDE